jgi:orotidine-5'-phosphate decarboxylase
MNKLGLLVAIFGLAILTSCGNEATEQGQGQDQAQEVIEQVQVQEVAPAMDSTATEATEATEVK